MARWLIIDGSDPQIVPSDVPSPVQSDWLRSRVRKMERMLWRHADKGEGGPVMPRDLEALVSLVRGAARDIEKRDAKIKAMKARITRLESQARTNKG